MYVPRLVEMGVPVEADEIATSTSATIDHLRAHLPDVRVVMAVGAAGMVDELRGAGFDATLAGDAVDESYDGGPLPRFYDAVIAGLDPSFDFRRLAAATTAIRAGARFIATNADLRYPTPTGFLPGAGSMVAALRASGGTEPLVIGKPEPGIFTAILERTGVRHDEAIAVGDNPDADMVAARRAGMGSILVLTGVADAEMAGDPRRGASPGSRRPRPVRGRQAAGRRGQLMSGGSAIQADHARLGRALHEVDDRAGAERTPEPVDGDGRQLVGAQLQSGRAAPHLLGERRVRDRPVVGGDGDAHSGPVERCEGMGGQLADDASLHVAGRAQVEGHVTFSKQRHHLRILCGRHPVGDAFHVEGERLADALGTRHLTGVRRQRRGPRRQPPRMRPRVEGPGTPPRVRPGRNPRPEVRRQPPPWPARRWPPEGASASP